MSVKEYVQLATRVDMSVKEYVQLATRVDMSVKEYVHTFCAHLFYVS